MDQVHEQDDIRDLKELLQEILKTQELMLRRLDALEESMRKERGTKSG